MKFSPENWKEVKPNDKIEITQGRLWLRLTQASPILVTSLSGVETLVCFDTEADIEVTDCAFAIFTNEKARGWLFERPVEYFESDGEIFTNADRMVMESGTMGEITKALRLFKIEQNSILREANAKLQEIQQEARSVRERQPDPDNPEDHEELDPVDDDQVDEEEVADPAPAPAPKAKK